jgi:hypothetical protein
MTPDIERLRKFSLLSALVLIGYVAAGVQLQPGAQISVLGVPFIISRPEFLPLALILTSCYGLIRWFYYAMMLNHSPHRRRKDLLEKMHPEGGRGTYKGSVFFGPSIYSTTPSTPNRADAEKEIVEVVGVFPKVWNIRAKGTIESQMVCDDVGEPYAIFEAKIAVPIACRLAAFLQDLDYTAPFWLNLCALLWAWVVL